MAVYLDAGTTYSKIITDETGLIVDTKPVKSLKKNDKIYQYFIIPSSSIQSLNLYVKSSCGHMTGADTQENEIIALAKGSIPYIEDDSTVLDLGSRDAKWVKFKKGKFQDMDWNTSCASSTGATVEMLLKFYDLKTQDLKFNEEKFNVTCGIFGLEKIMDAISHGEKSSVAVSKFVHGLAYNAWKFAKKPEKLYLSGGFCENECLVKSLQKYCQVELLGRFILCEGLINE